MRFSAFVFCLVAFSLIPFKVFADEANVSETEETKPERSPHDFTATQILEWNLVNERSVLVDKDIVAFYGHPNSRAMGIVGQYSLEALAPKLEAFAAEYDKVNGDKRGIIPAIYLIYGTCWPGGDIGYLSDEIITKYVEFAKEKGWLIFLDHQIGRFTVKQAMEKLLPYLKYDNVHLALDPEWRTTKPMQEIGYITGAEVNYAQQAMQDYLTENNLPGKRILVVHQFKPLMITNRGIIKSNYSKVNIVHCADGFGSPSVKKGAYKNNAAATNMPLKSFKLFSKPAISGAGYDIPMMSAEDVMKLDPRPCFIMLQ